MIRSRFSGNSSRRRSPSSPLVPRSLPRAYTPEVEKGHVQAMDTLSPIRSLQPLLTPSVLNQESADLYLPARAMDHQVEAINAFLKNDAFLLADDPGMGKTTSVCLALAAKMQAAQAQRALLACSEGSLHHTAKTLLDWAPGLSVTVVRGRFGGTKTGLEHTGPRVPGRSANAEG